MITVTDTLITLEPLDIEKHAEGYWRVCQDPQVHEYTGNTVPVRIEETIALLKKYETYFFNWMILSNETRGSHRSHPSGETENQRWYSCCGRISISRLPLLEKGPHEGSKEAVLSLCV